MKPPSNASQVRVSLEPAKKTPGPPPAMPRKRKPAGGYSADVYASDLKPPVLGSKAGIRCTEHPTCVNYDGHIGPHSIPKKRDGMKVFAVYYDEDSTGYKLEAFDVPNEATRPLLTIPSDVVYRSVLVVTEDARVLKNRFGGTTPKPKSDPAPFVAQPTCPSPHCELPEGHELGHYQTLPVKPFKLTLSELSITELCLLQDAYYHTPSHDLIIAELNKRWIK